MDQNNPHDKLFAEFSPVTTAEWEAKIVADLKGADYQKKLIWNSDEGIAVKPYYRSEDTEGLPLEDLHHLFRSLKGNSWDWMIREDIHEQTLSQANTLAKLAIAKGAAGIGLNAMKVSTHKDLQQLLTGIDLTKTRINFIGSRSFPLTCELLNYEVMNQNLDPKLVRGSLNFDALSYALIHGAFYTSFASNMEEAEYLVETAEKHLPGVRVITVNGQNFGNAGATTVQELAFTMAAANEYLYQLTSKELSIDVVAKHMMLSFSVGSNYFFEIAKLRAARLLWAQIIERYNPMHPESKNAFIHSVTSSWNKSLYDPYVNMLRTTTESMSAAIGGTDSLTVLPFNASYAQEDDFSSRIARNQQLILKEESYLHKVVDPSAGSYYIEHLTASIAEEAWKLFKLVEEKGGMVACIQEGFIQDEVAKSHQRRVGDLAQRKSVMIGTNQYPNLLEQMIDHVGGTLNNEPTGEQSFKKLTFFRVAEDLERIRLRTEQYVKSGHKQPEVFLLTIGNLAMRKARATFAANFFGCAGFKVTDNAGFTSIEEGIQGAVQSKAEVVVLCSSDDEYVTLVPEFCAQMKANFPSCKRVLAGFPKELVDGFKADGIQEFIHVRSNLVETLAKFQEEAGI